MLKGYTEIEFQSNKSRLFELSRKVDFFYSILFLLEKFMASLSACFKALTFNDKAFKQAKQRLCFECTQHTTSLMQSEAVEFNKSVGFHRCNES